ncbi:MAG: Abi family protein [Symbiobacteriaceae bacterium]|nr:Abi family protein [Symbiobacteriaceae bacterium]
MKTKPPTTYTEQLEILKIRGCLVEDEQKALTFLAQRNYYRVTAYLLPFRDSRTHLYVNNISFSRVIAIYEFDWHLRHLLHQFIEDVEINLRSRIAYFHAHKYGPLGYRDPMNFEPSFNHVAFMDRCKEDIRHQENTPFVRHHLNNYDGQFPLWVIVELMSLGTLSLMYKNLRQQDKLLLKHELGLMELESWLACLVDMRNCCAHGDRLYFRRFSKVPAVSTSIVLNKPNSLFTQILVLKWLYPDRDRWNSEFVTQLDDLIRSYSKSILLSHKGFRNSWRNELTWV